MSRTAAGALIGSAALPPDEDALIEGLTDEEERIFTESSCTSTRNEVTAAQLRRRHRAPRSLGTSASALAAYTWRSTSSARPSPEIFQRPIGGGSSRQ